MRNGEAVNTAAVFLSCDWGTSAFRLRLVDRRGLRVRAEIATDDGVQAVAAAGQGPVRRRAFLRVLRRGLVAVGAADEDDIPLIISGMATSTLGWHPLGYAHTPAQLDGSDLLTADDCLGGRRVKFVSGLRTHDEVMRGEEIELVGLFGGSARRALADDCLVVLTGTHAKHVRLRHGTIVGFRTHPTGELFALLVRHSTLAGTPGRGFSRKAFVDGVEFCRVHGTGTALFQTRARVVLGRLPTAQAADFLSGVLIGAELATLPPTGRIVLAAGPHLASRYRLALHTLFPRREFTHLPPAEVSRAVVAGHARLLSLP